MSIAWARFRRWLHIAWWGSSWNFPSRLANEPGWHQEWEHRHRGRLCELSCRCGRVFWMRGAPKCGDGYE